LHEVDVSRRRVHAGWLAAACTAFASVAGAQSGNGSDPWNSDPWDTRVRIMPLPTPLSPRIRRLPRESTRRHGPTLSAGHVRLSTRIEATVFQDSEYRRALALWGYSAFASAFALVNEAQFSVSPNILLGTRWAFGAGYGGETYDQSQMWLRAGDVSLTATLVHVARFKANRLVIPSLQVEAGAGFPAIDLRGEARGAVLMRLAAFVGITFATRAAGVTLRAGYVYEPWPDAGGTNVDLALSGLSLSLGVEQWQ
jgi:hypothetical protein